MRKKERERETERERERHTHTSRKKKVTVSTCGRLKWHFRKPGYRYHTFHTVPTQCDKRVSKMNHGAHHDGRLRDWHGMYEHTRRLLTRIMECNCKMMTTPFKADGRSHKNFKFGFWPLNQPPSLHVGHPCRVRRNESSMSTTCSNRYEFMSKRVKTHTNRSTLMCHVEIFGPW